MDVVETLVRHGGVAPVALLAARGCSSAQVRGAVRRGQVFHPRRGWVALPEADPRLVSAARSGGRVTCVSALSLLMVHTPGSPVPHLRVPTTARRLPSTPATIHRSDVGRPEDPIVDGIDVALSIAVRCLPRDDAVAVLDSVVNLRLLRRSEVLDVLADLPQCYRDYAGLIDGGAQSGIETRFRLGCRALNLPLRSQVPIGGVGRVDFLIGDRLVVEVDGRETHAPATAFAADRRRDLALKERGYLVLRLTYAQVMYEWPRVAALLRSLVARQEHRWAARHRRAGLVEL